MLPRRHRFAAAIRSARTLQPLLRRSRAWSARARLRTDGPRETALDLVLMMLERHRTDYDPQLTIIGAENLPSAGTTRATFIATAHTMLSKFITRVLFDRGVTLVGISAAPITISGTTHDANMLIPSRTLLVKVRDAFATGQTVSAMIDRGAKERHTRTIDTARGEFHITTPLLALAMERDVRILFLSVIVNEDWQVVMTLDVPHATTVDGVIDEFGGFLDRSVHAVHITPSQNVSTLPSVPPDIMPSRDAGPPI